MASVLNHLKILDSSLFPRIQTARKYFCTLSSYCLVTSDCSKSSESKRRTLQSADIKLTQTSCRTVKRFFRSGKICEGDTNTVNFTHKKTPDLEELNPEQKAELFNRPKSQTTIDEDEVSKFSDLAALWWDEGGDFEALHSLNDLRIPLIRDGLVIGKRLDEYKAFKPLEDCWILDVGSGGGILSEPLSRLGANVIGLDASEENIKIAQAHLLHDPDIRDCIKYIHATVESISNEQAGKFDAVVASEVLEHVAAPETFVSSCCQLVRPGGSIFFTTLNKTTLSYALGVVIAERVLGLVSPGTHDWNKFIPPRDLQYMLEQNGFTCQLVHGMLYNPLSKRWTWTKDTNINYAIHAIRSEEHMSEKVEDVRKEDQA